MVAAGHQLTKLLLWIRPCVEKIIRAFSLPGRGPFFKSEQFAWIASLEENWKKIRGELDVLLQQRQAIPYLQDIQIEQYDLTNDKKWQVYFLYAYGHQFADNCQACPKTAKLLKNIIGLQTAFFSILGPEKNIPPHRGFYNGVLRYHLALKIPEPQGSCMIKVADDVALWQEGKSIIFDDCYVHQVWNLSAEDRVVLFVDFVRPLPFFVSLLNHLFLFLMRRTPFIGNAIHKQEQWSKELL